MEARRIWRSSVARILSAKSAKPAPEVVASLAAECRFEMTGSARTDLDLICEKMGIVVRRELLKADAILHQTASGYLAILNSSATEAHQRFFLAHEIGHVAMYEATRSTLAFGHLLPSDRKSSDSVEVEELCDRFAADLLAPLTACTSLIPDEEVSLAVLKRIMAQFAIPTNVAAPRLIEAAKWPCAIVIWQPLYQEDNALIAMQPVNSWQKLFGGSQKPPATMPNKEEFLVPGSPIYALSNRSETTGKIISPFSNNDGKCIAQSGVLEGSPTCVITIMIPERYGFEMMRRVPPI